MLVSETRKLGRIESRAHIILVHSLLHGVRNWAQVALVLRQHGHGGLWEHDWVLSPAVREIGQEACHPSGSAEDSAL